MEQQTVTKKERKPKTRLSRFANGRLIFESGKVWKVQGENRYWVASQSHPGEIYNVLDKEDGLICDCKDSILSGNVCKHTHAVMDLQDAKDIAKAEVEEEEADEDEDEEDDEPEEIEEEEIKESFIA